MELGIFVSYLKVDKP